MSFLAAPSDETLRGRWKWFVGIGIILVIVGLIALANAVGRDQRSSQASWAPRGLITQPRSRK